MKRRYILLLIIMLFPFIINASNRPVDDHGKLSVNGTNIVDKNGNTFQLRGVSTHGIYWFPQYVNQDAFTYMRDEWKINAVRLAMYSDPNSGRSQSTYELVKKGVEYAKNAGLYVIIDWHILNDNDPNTYKSDAIEFFKQMASLYKDYDNVLYEICNEPHWVEWNSSIKPYAEDVIKEIRKIDNDAIIIVGTPTWSQDVDVVSKNPIKNQSNIIYTLHFYAGTHKDNIRNKMTTAINNGLPILVSEFGLVNADGNGSIDYDSASKWFNLIDKYNVGYFMWNLSNKNEGSAMINSNVNKTTGWNYNELTAHGKWFVDKLKKYNDTTVVEPTTRTTTTQQIDTTTTEPITDAIVISTEANNKTQNEVKEETKDNTTLIIVISVIVCVLLLIAGLIINKKKNNKNSNE